MIRRCGAHLSCLMSIVPQPRSPVVTVKSHQEDQTISTIGRKCITSKKKTDDKELQEKKISNLQTRNSEEKIPPIYGTDSEEEFNEIFNIELKKILAATRGGQPK